MIPYEVLEAFAMLGFAFGLIACVVAAHAVALVWRLDASVTEHIRKLAEASGLELVPKKEPPK